MNNYFINRSMLSQATIDSRQLGTLAYICHPVTEEGEYSGILYFKEKPISEIKLSVSSKFTNEQIDIDFNQQPKPDKIQKFELKKDGFILLYCSTGENGYHFKLFGNDPQRPLKFDSQRLGFGDLFVINLIRPGEYSVSSKYTKQVCTINVNPLDTNEINPDAIIIECSEKGFSQETVKIVPTQGIIFKINSTFDFNIQYIENKTESFAKTSIQKVRWTNPNAISAPKKGRGKK